MNKNTKFYYEKLKSSLDDNQIVLLDQLIDSQFKDDNPYICMQGTALLEKLKTGIFPGNCYIVVHSPNDEQICIIYYSKDKGFRWKPGSFNAGWFIDNDYSFSVLDYSFSTSTLLPENVSQDIENAIDNVIKKAAGL